MAFTGLLAYLAMLSPVLASHSAASHAATPVPVLTTRANETQPAAGGPYLAWTESSRAHPLRADAYARRAGQPRFKLNPHGTVGFTSAGAIDGTRIVYQQRSSPYSTGVLKFFDLATRKRSKAPPGVNTPGEQCCASLSGRWLLFERGTVQGFRHGRPPQRVILFDLVTMRARQLDVAPKRGFVEPGTVRGNYASWGKCLPGGCHGYVYNIATGKTVRIPSPSQRPEYALAVTANGIVYFAESKNSDCGSDATLWRYPLGGARNRLLSFPHGIDVSTVDPFVNTDGSTTLLYDRIRCKPVESDIFKLSLGPGKR